MGIAAQDDAGLGPGRPQPFDDPAHDHGIFGAGRALAGAQRGGDELAREPREPEPRQVAVMTVVVMVEAEFLLPVRGVLGIIPVQHKPRRWRGVAGDERIDESPRQAIQLFGRDGLFQPGKGRTTRQIRRRGQRMWATSFGFSEALLA